MTNPKAIILTILLTLIAPQITKAERADRNQPMNIEADAMRYEENQQISTFTGKVIITKGSIVMRGARLVVNQDQNGNQYGKLYSEKGSPAYFRQKREGVNEYIEGTANTIEYNGQNDTMHLNGNAKLKRLENTRELDQISGQTIIYNNHTEVYTVQGATGTNTKPQSGRVNAILAPRNPQTPSAPQTPLNLKNTNKITPQKTKQQESAQ